MSNDTLKSCPFCQSSNLRLHFDGETECRSCGAVAVSPEAWNTRAPQADPVSNDTRASEPVAWMYTHPKDGCYIREEQRHIHEGWTETPLYPRPAPAADDGMVEALEICAEALSREELHIEGVDECTLCEARETAAQALDRIKGTSNAD